MLRKTFGTLKSFLNGKKDMFVVLPNDVIVLKKDFKGEVPVEQKKQKSEKKSSNNTQLSEQQKKNAKKEKKAKAVESAPPQEQFNSTLIAVLLVIIVGLFGFVFVEGNPTLKRLFNL
jgi:hypothetical protein